MGKSGLSSPGACAHGLPAYCSPGSAVLSEELGGETEACREPPLPFGGRLEEGWSKEKLAGISTDPMVGPPA